MKKKIDSFPSFKMNKISLENSAKVTGGQEVYDTIEYLGGQACTDRYYPEIFSHFCNGSPEKCVIVCE